MKRFRFKLQPVLNQREREERDRQLEVARLEAERLKLENTLRRQQENVSAGKDALREAMGAGQGEASIAEGGHRVRPDVLRMQATNALHLNFRAHQTVLGLAGLHARLDEARGRLVEASRRRRAIELLKERREGEWKRESERRERVDQDELITSRTARADDDTITPNPRASA